MTEGDELSVNIEIPFRTQRVAEIVYHVLRVDAEPKKSVAKEVSHNDNCLTVEFQGTSSKQIRVAVNSLFENVSLIAETIDCFGGNISESYNHF